MEEANEITLQEIFQILWQKVLLILGAVLVGGTIAFSVSYYVLEPTYSAHISMYVNSNTEKENTIATINDINASQKLVSTYIEILKSDTVLGRVLEETEVDCTINQLRSQISANSVNGTEIFEVTVTNKDAEQAAYIANTIGKVAPAEIIRVVKAGSVELIDKAVATTIPTSPNVLLNTVIGVMLGGVLSVLLVLVAAMMDNRIKSEDELRKNYVLPVLGGIPNLEDGTVRVK